MFQNYFNISTITIYVKKLLLIKFSKTVIIVLNLNFVYWKDLYLYIKFERREKEFGNRRNNDWNIER